MTHTTLNMRTYHHIFLLLLALLGLTIVLAYCPLGPAEAIAAFSIAIAKAVLIILFFMHLRFSSPLTRVFAVTAVFWLMLLMGLTLVEYL